MKFIITESDKDHIKKQYGSLLMEASNTPVNVMGEYVNYNFDELIEKLKRDGIFDNTAKANVNILVPIEQLRRYVLSLLPKVWSDISTTGNGGNELMTNITNKIYEMTKIELSKIPFLKRKAAKVMMMTKYGGKEKYINTEMSKWAGEVKDFLQDLRYIPNKSVVGVTTDTTKPIRQRYEKYTDDTYNFMDKNSDNVTRQILNLIWDSL
jgi:hypothetical protein